MGFYTWTLANKELKRTRSGDYAARCKLPYGGYGAVVCPDGTLLKEPHYEGYGEFAGQDIFELVADWNRDSVRAVMSDPRFVEWHVITDLHRAVIFAWADHDDDAFSKALAAVVRTDPIWKREWKRSIGIYLSADNNGILPYPIKIVDSVRRRPYDRLPPSVQTQ